MQWSKLKSRIKAFICPELRKRIDFHVTSYRHSHDEAEKCWITIDGKRVLTLGWYAFHRQVQEASEQSRENRAIHPPQQLGNAMRTYLALPVKQAIQSEDPLIRALAIVDWRIGARTLQRIRLGVDDHPLVKAFFGLRISK
jgi:hypothetical protein